MQVRFAMSGVLRPQLCCFITKYIPNRLRTSGSRFSSYVSQQTARRPKDPFYSPETSPTPAPYQSATRTVNIAKDVLLYSSDNKRFFKYMTWFSVVQLVFWIQMAFFPLLNFYRYISSEGSEGTQAKQSSMDARQSDRWYVKYVMGQVSPDRPYYSLLMGCSYILVGVLVTFGGCFYALRSISSLILKKGGETAVIKTYAPLGNLRTMTLPIENITAKRGRQGAVGFLPLKLKGRRSVFLMNMQGTFHNPSLFDITAGLHRSWYKK